MNRSKKIVLISSGQPSLNPRLVKEADALTNDGYKVTVIYQYWNDWGTRLDQNLLGQKSWKAIRVGGGTDKEKPIYLLTRLRFKVGQVIMRIAGVKAFPELAIGRCTALLTTEAFKHPADLYIAHNLGALPAAVKAAKKYNVRCGFDAEDFHRHEVTDEPSSLDVQLKAVIEDKYFPQLSYLSTASPLISDEYRRLYRINPVTILNTFPKVKLQPAQPTGKDLKLFWFSQTVSADRGVGDCILALQKINGFRIELHLLGFTSDAVKSQLLTLGGSAAKIIFHDPAFPDDIISFAAQFDIGLAMEDSVPYNRDICLTNKIFTYIQAGLAVIASDTTAQKQFMAGYAATGEVYKKRDIGSLANAIHYFAEHPEYLTAAKEASRKAAGTLNWETESQKLLSLIKSTLAA